MPFLPGMMDAMSALSRIPSMMPPTRPVEYSPYGTTPIGNRPSGGSRSMAFPGMMGGSSRSGGRSNDFDPYAAGMAEEERRAALAALNRSEVADDPMLAQARMYYNSVLNGNLPYGEKQKNLMYSRATDEVAASQNAARTAAMQRAGSMGLGRGAALASQMRALESNAALNRQGARSDIENTATMANTAAQQAAAAGLGGLFGTSQSLQNPLRTAEANLRASTQFRSGVGQQAGASRSGGVQDNRTYGTDLRGRQTVRGSVTGNNAFSNIASRNSGGGAGFRWQPYWGLSGMGRARTYV